MKEIHHANVIVGNIQHKQFVFDILENDLGFKVVGNPDFLLMEAEGFSIDEARSLIRWAQGKPLASDIKVSLIVARSIGIEAQNALLKVLEEPPVGTFFFLVLESLGNILPTFLSRVRITFLEVEIEKEENKNAHKFLKGSLKERFSLIQSLAKKEDKSEIKGLVKSLESQARKSGLKVDDMKKLLKAKILLTARGSSPKMLLEWLACVVSL